MLFNSTVFLLLFLPMTVIVVHAVARVGNNGILSLVLLALSLVFYAYWDWRNVPVLVISIAFNFVLGHHLRKYRSKMWAFFGVTANITLLFVYKYYAFALVTTNSILGTSFVAHAIDLPLAISFFTFTQIAYLVDSYCSESFEHYSLRDYALFVAYFPHLIAGPIVHHRQLIPQLRVMAEKINISTQTLNRALLLIIVGLFKKVVVADHLAAWVDSPFSSPALLSTYDAWTAMLAYTLQIYFDFSAYSEMAMGISLLFGIELPLNFNSPYQATTIQHFWRRWHITLSDFLRCYVYIPLGGSYRGAVRTAAAILATMAIGGLWHGAGWQFVAWGVLHAVYQIIYRIWMRIGFRLNPIVAQSLTLFAVASAWVLFRSDSISSAWQFYRALGGLNISTLPLYYADVPGLSTWFNVKQSPFYVGVELWAVLALLLFCAHMPNIHQWINEVVPTWKTRVALSFAIVLVVFNLGSPSTFLYFQF